MPQGDAFVAQEPIVQRLRKAAGANASAKSDKGLEPFQLHPARTRKGLIPTIKTWAKEAKCCFFEAEMLLHRIAGLAVEFRPFFVPSPPRSASVPWGSMNGGGPAVQSWWHAAITANRAHKTSLTSRKPGDAPRRAIPQPGRPLFPSSVAKVTSFCTCLEAARIP